MSIFGPDPGSSRGASPTASREASSNVDLSAYAKKDYVDQKDNLRVLKRGDTMTGDLNMRRRLVRGLPTDYPPRYSGDEAVSWRQSIGLMNDYFQMALRLDGHSIMSGVLQMGNHNIKDVKDPLQPQDAATKNYVDSRGITITGDLKMDYHRIKVLRDPTDPLDAATKRYVDNQRRKPVITVWAERKHAARRAYEWSFGGNANASGKNTGYTMMAPGRIIRMGLAIATRDGSPRDGSPVDLARVTIMINGVETTHGVTTSDPAGVFVFRPPILLAGRDILNFKTNLMPGNVASEVATLLIELDLQIEY